MISIYYPPYGFGGDAIYLHRLCSELVRDGHEVDVIHCADSFNMFVPNVDPSAFPVSQGVTIHTLRSGAGMLSPLLSHQSGQPFLKRGKIERILSSKRYDIIHYHNVSLLGPGVLAIEPPYPVVKLYTAHEHWLVCPTNVLWENNARVCDTPSCLTCTVRSKRPPQLWRYSGMLRAAAKHVDLFLTPSRSSYQNHRDRGFKPEMKVLPYFASPLGGVGRADQDSSHKRPYFLFVGRLEKIKGVQEILRHFQAPGDYDLLVVGAGRYEKELHEQAQGMPRVRFVGWLIRIPRPVGRTNRRIGLRSIPGCKLPRLLMSRERLAEFRSAHLLPRAIPF